MKRRRVPQFSAAPTTLSSFEDNRMKSEISIARAHRSQEDRSRCVRRLRWREQCTRFNKSNVPTQRCTRGWTVCHLEHELSICARVCTLGRMLHSFLSELAEENGLLGENGGNKKLSRGKHRETRGRERTVASVERSTTSICGMRTVRIQPRGIGFTI